MESSTPLLTSKQTGGKPNRKRQLDKPKDQESNAGDSEKTAPTGVNEQELLKQKLQQLELELGGPPQLEPQAPDAPRGY